MHILIFIRIIMHFIPTPLWSRIQLRSNAAVLIPQPDCRDQRLQVLLLSGLLSLFCRFGNLLYVKKNIYIGLVVVKI